MVDQAVNRLQRKEVVERVQEGQAGFSWGERVKFWSKTSGKERNTMIMEEASQVELECYLIKAVSQGKQRAWPRWEDIIHRAITWRDIWKTPQAWPSFLVRATKPVAVVLGAGWEAKHR